MSYISPEGFGGPLHAEAPQSVAPFFGGRHPFAATTFWPLRGQNGGASERPPQLAPLSNNGAKACFGPGRVLPGPKQAFARRSRALLCWNNRVVNNNPEWGEGMASEQAATGASRRIWLVQVTFDLLALKFLSHLL